MTRREGLIAGRCPGALKPMTSQDGLIVRVRPRLGKLSLAQFEALAAVSAGFGDSNLYLSNRANVQIRAISSDNHGGALALLTRVGLIDGDPSVEAVRNIMVTPAIGARGVELAGKIECVLADSSELHSLPGKFGTAIQAGEQVDPSYVSDVTLLVRPGGDIIMLLEGAADLAALFRDVESAALGFAKACKGFLRLRQSRPDMRRMRHAIREIGAEAILQEACLSPVALELFERAASAQVGDLGPTFGIGFAFGEIAGTATGEIIGFMRQHNLAEVYVTPRRTLVFLKGACPDDALLQLAGRIGAIIDPSDVRLRIHACRGAPVCGRGSVQAREDARAVLNALPHMIAAETTIHVSGCEKRCAYPHEADISAIGSEGTYDVFGRGMPTRRRVAPVDLPNAIAELARRP